MFNAIERFRTIGSESFLDRGTVRRGGLRGIILEFAFERENMLLHIFRLEAKASPKRPAKKQHRDARAPKAFGGRGYNWQGPAKHETGKDAVYAADGTLAARCFAGFWKVYPRDAGRRSGVVLGEAGFSWEKEEVGDCWDPME